MYSIDFSKTAKKELTEYKKSNPMAFKKLPRCWARCKFIHEKEQVIQNPY